jgi:hypothetical protein
MNFKDLEVYGGRVFVNRLTPGSKEEREHMSDSQQYGQSSTPFSPEHVQAI